MMNFSYWGVDFSSEHFDPLSGFLERDIVTTSKERSSDVLYLRCLSFEPEGLTIS